MSAEVAIAGREGIVPRNVRCICLDFDFWFIGHVFSTIVVPGKGIVSVICTVRDVKPNNLILFLHSSA